MASFVDHIGGSTRPVNRNGSTRRTGIVRVLAIDAGHGLWGAQRVLLRLAPLLAERGFELILASPPDRALAHAWLASGLPAVTIEDSGARSIRRDGDTGPVSATRALRTAFGVRHAVRGIVEAARSTGADLLLANSHWSHLDAALAGRRGDVPAILLLHEEAVPGVGAALRSLAVWLGGGAVAVSRAVAAGLGRQARQRTSIVPNGVDHHRLVPAAPDPAVRAELGAAAGDVLVVAVTRLDPVKRVEDVVAALASVTGPVHLAVAGATSDYPDYAAQVRRAAAEQLGARVSFLGARDDVPEVLAAADLVVHCGTVEGMPLGLLEAQACGRAVVAYDVAGVSEAVCDQVTGLLVPAGDVAGITGAVQHLVDDPVLRSEMGRRGREQVERAHTLDRQADELAAVLHRAATR